MGQSIGLVTTRADVARRRRLSAGRFGALLVGFLVATLTPVVGASAAAPPPTLSLAGPASSVVSTPVTLTVTGTNLNNGAKITLQKFGGLFWNNVGTATYSAVTQQATFSVTPTAVGTVRYRATTPNPALLQPAIKSPEFQLVTTATAPPPPPDCGATVLRSDGTPWECTFADDFTGAQLDRTKWVPQTNFVNGSTTHYACYIDDSSVVSQSDGTLKLSTRKMPSPVNCPASVPDVPYASGQISTYYKWSQMHGRFEARMKSPLFDQTKLHEAFWLWPDVRTESAVPPHTGEIDISETFGEYPSLSVPFLHYNDGTGPIPYTGSNSAVANTAHNCSANRGVWNTYTLEWDASRLEIKVNGQTCLVNTSGHSALNKKYIVALTSAMAPSANSYADLEAGPKTTEVDYIRAWK